MRRSVTLISVVLVTAIAVATAATAGQPDRYRSSGRNVSTWWTQVDGPPAAGQQFGNVHAGWLDAWESSSGTADVFVYVDDFSCPEGVMPWDGHGGHGEEPVDGTFCTHLGSRYGEGYGLALTVDRKLTSATLKGQITMSAHGGHGEQGPVLGRPMVDIRFTGQGQLGRSNGTWRGTDGFSRYFDRYTQQYRNAVVTGSIGPMGFDPALSGGSISSYSSMYVWQQR